MSFNLRVALGHYLCSLSIRFYLDTTVAKHVKMAASKIRIRANRNFG
jgi:hypothetical protein